jgi:RimJ/RimL family protein N-acetyltransferase
VTSRSWDIRHATPEDFEAWRAVFAEVASEGRWIGAEQAPPADTMRPAFEARVRDPDRLFLIAHASTVVGALKADFVLPGVLELGMEISAGWRGQGIGSALIEQCLAWAREHAAHKVVLEAWPHNAAALALYEKYRFVREGRLRRHWRRRNGELWDLIYMGLVLDDTSPGSPHPDSSL